MSPSEIWPMIVASAAVVFGAGQLVEKVRNGKYVRKEICQMTHKNENEWRDRIQEDVAIIRSWIDKQNETQ